MDQSIKLSNSYKAVKELDLSNISKMKAYIIGLTCDEVHRESSSSSSSSFSFSLLIVGAHNLIRRMNI